MVIYIEDPDKQAPKLIHDDEADYLNVSFRHCRINRVKLKRAG
ncbi:hypothetical protein EVB56_062 [Rhizobium phage RHph_Y1_10]|nr:hypothetical protein EVB56_062 [Rhizobium phage RHph_Y1_10]